MKSDEKSQNGWAFVLNPIIIDAELPFEIIPGCFLDKATVKQRKQIKENLTKLVAHSSLIQPELRYENEPIVEQLEQGATQTSWKPLPETEWRYHIVTVPDKGPTSNDLHLVSNISDAPLEIGALRFPKSGGMIWNSGVLQNHFEFGLIPTARKVVCDTLNMSELFRAFVELKNGAAGTNGFPEIIRALSMFDSLRLLPASSTFHILGLFAIIEMLITHNPKLEDRGDSITHQMQSKIPLLSNRFDRTLDFPCFFSTASDKKIWAALYGYRSSLAHGGLPNFKKEFKILKDADNVKLFLMEVVKSLLRHSLKEPQLYRDLRGC